MANAIMIQGTGTNVGKSMLVAGLARAYWRRGLSVMPFKPQNMSNNAAVTDDGGEIGRAQALQARAAGIAPTFDMNPVLLKPESPTGAQVIVQGQRLKTLSARDFTKFKETLLPRVLESFTRLATRCDLVLVEGAGSPAETNLRSRDIANMGFAQAANVPVVLIGDIERGGVIAQIVGTHAVLSVEDRNLVKGFAINKFRGDPDLFAAGAREIEHRTGWRNLGLLGWFEQSWRLPGEDVMDIASSRADSNGNSNSDNTLKIAVPRLDRIANFDDLDPLMNEPGTNVEIIEPGRPFPGDADLVLIIGSKSTISDLAAFRANGWDIDLAAHIRRGGHVLGLCGGYQMLGRSIADPDGVEGDPVTVDGLGHLNVATVMHQVKRLAKTRARYLDGDVSVTGYEIHMGQTRGPDTDRAWLSVDDTGQGAASSDGRIMGCYLHGLFASDAFRKAYLRRIGGTGSTLNYEAMVDKTLDQLAAHLERDLDLDALTDLAEPVG